jgi:hypothetical protein
MPSAAWRASQPSKTSRCKAASVEKPHYVERYWLSAVPSDFGQAFYLEKIGPEAEESRHHVCLETDRRTCECKGFTRWGHCKYTDGLAALQAAGKL